MTLSLDEVRSIRFPMARKPNEDGYRASSVDKFMDELEISYADLVNENEKLKANAGSGEENAKLGQQVEQLNNQVTGLGRENEQLRAQLNDLRSSSDQGSAAAAQLSGENEQLRAQIAELQSRLQDAQNAAAATSVQPAVSGEPQHVVVTTAEEAGPWAARLLEMSTREADQLVEEANRKAAELQSGAESEAERIRSDARVQADQLVEEATQKAARLDYEARNTADRVTAEAQENAKRVTDEAQQRADALDGEVASKRAELLSALEAERDNLTASVSQLRGFESEYRSNIEGQIQRHLESLRSLSLRPTAGGQTPRLDALLGNQED